MSYQQENLPWAQMQLQNAAQYQQQIPGFMTPQQQPQLQANILSQSAPQQVPQNVFNNLPLQQPTVFSQQPQIQNQPYSQPQSGQPPPPFLAQTVRQPAPQWTSPPPPNQYQQFQRPPPPQRPQLHQIRNTGNSSWNNSIENARPGSSDRSKSQVDRQEESSLMDYDFGHMGAAAKNFNVESTKEKESQAVYDGSDSMEHDGIQPTQIPDSDSYRQRHGLKIWDSSNRNASDATEIAPPPYQRFEDFKGLSRNQLQNFYNCGFTAPTPIQAQSWPIAMADRDMVSIAKTGSGKTLAFLLPAYRKMDIKKGPNGTINVLILAPTRELATQIQEEAEKFGHAAGYYSTCAYGGAPRSGQLEAIRRGVSIVVATPGRLNDFIDSNQIDLSSVFYLVLDEADRMLDMGFEPQIRAIIKKVPRRRQTMMFSATWPRDVRQLANDFLVRPIHVQLGDSAGGGLQANADIKQHLLLLETEEEKDLQLYDILKDRFHRNRNDLALIFVARKNTCDVVTNMLNRKGIGAAAMHSDREQKHREKTLAAFKEGSTPVLVATDVASRGLDVRGIGIVINYDLANTTEDYVHRIGRTGRAGDKGESITFLTRSGEDTYKAMGIIDVMRKNGQSPPPAVQQMVDAMVQRQQRNRERNTTENEQFVKVLMVAEKPSVAKMVAEHLSGGRLRTRRGQSRALQIFEFIKYFGPARQKCKLMVTSVVGHVYGLTFEDGRVRDLADLFKAKVRKNIEDSTKKLKVIEHLQELAQEAEYLCLWLDCDLEGENIGFEVISLCQEWIPFGNVYRAKFSALTEQELKFAFDNLIRPDKYQAMCVDARQELDLKIGVTFTRLMTRTYLDTAKEKFRLKDQTCISYGPCQTPTLSFCIKRHKEIQAFRSQAIYHIIPNINIDGYDVPFKWADGEHITNQAESNKMESAIKAAVQENGGTILDVQENKKKVNRPIGLNTVTLLKACSKGLGMSPVTAMKAAEHLYTSGYISYPRTETTAYSPTFDLIGALQEQVEHPNWGKVVNYLLRSGRVKTPEKGHDVGDHPPITPMKAATRDELSKGGEWKIYDYVTRHFIASLHDDMEYIEKKVVVNINGYKFHYLWHEVVDNGFIFAMPWKRKNMQLNEIDWTMPQYMLQKGARVRVNGYDTQTDQTKPPDYLQESDLIALMDKHRIGTDASIPTHVKNICDRHYVDVCGPGEDGQKGAIIRIQRGGAHFAKMRGGRGGARGGKQDGGDKPQSRHMVPRGFGLAFFSCFEELDNELCDPPIRAWMESQVKKIATRETEKNEVVDSTIELFLDKFLRFREKLSRCDRFFGVKSDSGSNFGGGGNFNGDRGYGGDRGGYEERGPGYGGERRGGFGGDRGGRGFQGRGAGRGGGTVGRGGGRGGSFAQAGQGGGRGVAPRFGGRDNGRGGFGNNANGNNSTRGGRGKGNYNENDYDSNDYSYGAKRPSGDKTEDYTKRFRGGENSRDQHRSQNQGKAPMQPPEGCSWW